MAKRFTDTFKWQRPWFRNLPPPYRELWLYILDMCDQAGIWYVDFQMAELVLNCKIERTQAEAHFSKQVNVIDESRWWIKDFVVFQYGNLSQKSKFHTSIIAVLKKFKLQIPKGSKTGCPHPVDRPKVKDKDKVKDKEGVEVHQKEWFEKIWEEYPRKGRIKKAEAFKRFGSSVPDVDTAKRCAAALDKYIDSKRVKEGYVQNAPTWFGDWTSWENYEESTLPGRQEA